MNRVKTYDRSNSYDVSGGTIFGSTSDGYNRAYLSGEEYRKSASASYGQENYEQQYQSSLLLVKQKKKDVQILTQ